jgi:glycosyltransferase involved in cell wall biosynthesis
MLNGQVRVAGCVGVVGSLNPMSGGEFQYSLSVLRALDRIGAREFAVFARPHERTLLDQLALSQRFRVVPLDPPGTGRLVGNLKSLARRLPMAARLQEWQLRRVAVARQNGVRTQPAVAAHFRAHGASWIFYTAPNVMSFEAGLPFVMPIHDMQHRLQPHFPEVSAHGEWERREYLFGNAARHARMILVDSDVSRDDVLTAYGDLGLTEERIGVLPYLSPDYLRAGVPDANRPTVRERYRLPDRYLFYPAQFWPHKNHQRLVTAIAEVARRHSDIALILVGSAGGDIRAATYENAWRAIKQLGIATNVRHLGYVPNGDMLELYASADALVFPTFFGPTNIPILEAWALGVPVMTSRIRGVTEQAGDAALLADPSDTSEMAAAIERLWTDPALRSELIRRGHARLALYDAAEFDSRLKDIMDRIGQF